MKSSYLGYLNKILKNLLENKILDLLKIIRRNLYSDYWQKAWQLKEKTLNPPSTTSSEVSIIK